MPERSSILESEALQAAPPYYQVNDGAAITEDISQGYKRTEVRSLPEDWNVLMLGKLCRAIIDGTHHTPSYVPDGVPFYSVENISQNDFENVKFITVDEHKQLTLRCNPEQGDILMTRIGSLGVTKLLDWDVKASIYVSLALLKMGDAADPEYIYAYSKCDQFVEDVESRSLLNASPKKINVGDISRVPIPVPKNREEQCAIATALSDADALIESLDRLIAKKRAIKQSTMQQLLTGETRLPGYEGVWERKQLAEIGRFKGGTGFPTANQGASSGYYPFFKVSDMSNAGNALYMKSANNFVSENTQKLIGASVFPPNSIVFAKVGAAIFLERKKMLDRPSCIDNNMAVFIPDTSRVDPRFIHCFFCVTHLGGLVSTTALPSLGGRVLSEIGIQLPPKAEQQAITTVLTDMDAEIEALEHRRDKTRQIKEGMMQELLTGRTRLVQPEQEAVEEAVT